MQKMKYTRILVFLILLVFSSCSKDINVSLLDASSQGDIETVQTLLDKKADVNTKTNNGTTPLMMAAMKGHVAIVKLLIDNGAFVNAKNKFGVTALMYAALENRKDVVLALLDRGARVNLTTKKGKTALMFALKSKNRETAGILKKIEALSNSKPLDKGFYSNLIAAVASGHVPSVKRLINKGVDINERDDDGNTALIWASSLGHTAIVKVLLEKGADVNIKNNYEHTALKSVSYANLEIIGLLKKAGAKR
jgi:ankyrin repeat protein